MIIFPSDHPHDAEAESADALYYARVLISGWRAILLASLVCLGIGVIYLHVARPTYTASLTLSPTQSQTEGISGNLGALASMAGISVGRGQTASPFLLFPYEMISRPVAEDAIQHAPDIMHVLFEDQWDAESRSWREPNGLLHVIARPIKAMLGYPASDWTPPGAGDLQQFIGKEVAVESSAQKPVISLSFAHHDRDFAARFLQVIYESTDRVLRKAVLDRSSKYKAYLQNQLQVTQLSELRQVMMQSLTEQETLVMMSSSDAPFAAQPMGQAVSSVRPTSPNVPIVLLLSLVMGIALGCGWILLRMPTPWFLRGRPQMRALNQHA